MPQFKWHDGSLKYLHVDVHLIEGYQVSNMHILLIPNVLLPVLQVRVEEYVTMVQQRLNWLTSGSRAPFGVISEKKYYTFHVTSKMMILWLFLVQQCVAASGVLCCDSTIHLSAPEQPTPPVE